LEVETALLLKSMTSAKTTTWSTTTIHTAHHVEKHLGVYASRTPSETSVHTTTKTIHWVHQVRSRVVTLALLWVG
jgi:hypothetical protein